MINIAVRLSFSRIPLAVMRDNASLAGNAERIYVMRTTFDLAMPALPTGDGMVM